MQWQNLLIKTRLGKLDNAIGKTVDDRSAFQKDVDRIIFSSAFRRLQDKTQVFPLAKNDYVRTRLTHSLEVASVGRSIANQVGEQIIRRHNLSKHQQTKDIQRDDFGAIVNAACLAHDIGNPPFGHFGESAFRAFFSEHEIGKEIIANLSSEQQRDLLYFEGNAQGFRILTKLQSPETIGGMQLTYAMLGAFTKYPCTSEFINSGYAGTKKNGLFIDDFANFEIIANELQLPRLADKSFARHPLVYLMEAADDICYGIIDIEDAYQVREISFADAQSLLMALVNSAEITRYQQINSKSDKISYLRAKAIGCLVKEVVEQFLDCESAILAGNFKLTIAQQIPNKIALKALTDFAAKNVYKCSRVVKIEVGGYKIITDLLALFCKAVNDVAIHGDKVAQVSPISDMVINLLPKRFLRYDAQIIGQNGAALNEQGKPDADLYKRILGVCDFISGMTDSYAVNLHKKLMGIDIL